MKKSITFFLIILFGLNLNAQIKSFIVDGSKEYVNKTRTSYLTFSGYIAPELSGVITTEMSKHPLILVFSFYDKTDYLKCMYTSDLRLDDQQVIDLINDIITQNTKPVAAYEFPNTVYSLDTKLVEIKIQGIKTEEHKKQIIQELLRYDQIITVEINKDNYCNIVMNKSMNSQKVKDILINEKLVLVGIE
jgi:hypothetical protein